MGKLSDGQKVKHEPLGKGGQSMVYLVRRPERTEARQRSFAALKAWSGQDLGNQDAALAFSKAAVDVAREDHPSELAERQLRRCTGVVPATEVPEVLR
jgi:hypothetical protein